MKNKIRELVFASKIIGNNPAYVQGGGGNTSIKIDARLMAVKASGSLLKDMSEQNGYSIVDYPSIKAALTASDDEDSLNQTLQSWVVKTNNRPSMETSFHALSGEFIIHTHSVYANLLTCAKEGKDIALKLFPEALWVDYATPGRKLALAIQKILPASQKIPEITFLENHGVVVVEKTARTALNSHENLNRKIQDHFGIFQQDFKLSKQNLGFDVLKHNILFPDQAVYTLAGEDILRTTAAQETLAAYGFILRTIHAKALTPNFLAEKEAETLLSLESEKFRQQALKK